MTHGPFRRAHRAHHRGVVLMVALIFLLLLTILGVGASGRSLLQQRMAGALNNASLADMAAQTTLRAVEWRLWSASATGQPLLCGTGALGGACYRYDPSHAAAYGDAGVVSRFRNASGWVTRGAVAYADANGGELARDPVYIIEDMGIELPSGSGVLHESGATGTGGHAGGASRRVYRITARAVGADVNTVRLMESTFTAKSD